MTMTCTLGLLSRADLSLLGIDPPRGYVDAYRNDETSITFLMPDEDGGYSVDPPNEDHSGEDAWEWIAFDSGYERNEWIAANFDCQICCSPADPSTPCEAYDEVGEHDFPDAFRPGLDFWIERYEHGLVRYAPINESSQVDRQWDVAQGVALMRIKDDPWWREGTRAIDCVRAVCEEYTSWCNGDVFGMIRYELKRPDVPPVPFLTVEDFASEWVETDSCWGFLGYDYARQTAKDGDW